jgi:hypothetical protein
VAVVLDVDEPVEFPVDADDVTFSLDGFDSFFSEDVFVPVEARESLR